MTATTRGRSREGLMRILLLTLGSRGDVQPYAALGTALRAGGHTVTLATASGFGDMIEQAGLDYHEIPLDFRALVATPEMRAATRSVRGLIAAMRSGGEVVDVSLMGSWDAALAYRPDIIVYHPKMLAAPHIAERLGIPAVLAAVVPALSPTGAYPNPLVPMSGLSPSLNRMGHRLVLAASKRAYIGRIRRFREQVLDLPSRSGTDLLGIAGRPIPRLIGVSRVLVPEPAERMPGPTLFTGYWFAQAETEWEPPVELARFLEGEEPPVYVGFGSMAAGDEETLADTAAIVEALREEGLRGVLVKGWGGIGLDGDVPSHVHVLEAAPHSWLFPRCSAIIHHGGAGTTHEGLRWGRPTAIRPTFGDQPFWARRVRAIGAGPGAIGKGRLNVEALRRVLRKLRDPSVVRAAETAGDRIRAEPGAAGGAKVLERLARGSER